MILLNFVCAISLCWRRNLVEQNWPSKNNIKFIWLVF